MKNWNTRVVVGQREIVSIEEYSKHLLTDTTQKQGIIECYSTVYVWHPLSHTGR